jgi:hypothetical protein
MISLNSHHPGTIPKSFTWSYQPSLGNSYIAQRSSCNTFTEEKTIPAVIRMAKCSYEYFQWTKDLQFNISYPDVYLDQ